MDNYSTYYEITIPQYYEITIPQYYESITI